MAGKACIRGMRITVSTGVGQIGAGYSVDEVLQDYPYLEREDVLQAIRYAAMLAGEREAQSFRTAADVAVLSGRVGKAERGKRAGGRGQVRERGCESAILATLHRLCCITVCLARTLSLTTNFDFEKSPMSVSSQLRRTTPAEAETTTQVGYPAVYWLIADAA